jgi:hypothetical protein
VAGAVRGDEGQGGRDWLCGQQPYGAVGEQAGGSIRAVGEQLATALPQEWRKQVGKPLVCVGEGWGGVRWGGVCTQGDVRVWAVGQGAGTHHCRKNGGNRMCSYL